MNSVPINLLSYNIHKGFNAGNRVFVLDHIRQAIRATGATIVCLQEVVGENRLHAQKNSEWISEAQFEFLADQVWHHQAYGKNAVYPHGHHGNAILSHYPLCSQQNHNISVMPFSQRGILHAVTEQGVHILCAHFGLLAWERRRQITLLEQLLSKLPATAPLVLAGDFNDWDEKTHKRLLSCGLQEAMTEIGGRPYRTFPALLPLLRMDRIYYRHLRLHTARRMHDPVWRILSDHCPLYAEFTYGD
jgi:endonuclease/exonuclease/phosphatase family metal-dependent hydrolase